jgi:3,4-dihydroxy 2-butanone 4-phosphate synthase / GTP cyclohydrolase II
VARALDDLRAGRPVIVFGEPVTPGGAAATLVFAAQYATTATLAFVIRHSCGFVCIALPDRQCDRLILPAMSTVGDRQDATRFRVSVDAADGVTTGISAADRALTMRALSDPATTPACLTRPGHVVVCGISELPVSRPPRAEQAALKMVAAAGLRLAAGFSAMVNDIDHGDVLPPEMVNRFAAEHDLGVVSVTDLPGRHLPHELPREPRCHRRPLGVVQTQAGAFSAVGYRWGSTNHVEDLVFTFGDLAGDDPVPLAVHAECAFAPIPGVLGCECSSRLKESFDQIAATGRGVLVYLRNNAETPSPVSAGIRRDHILATIALPSVCLLQDNARGAARCARLESPCATGHSALRL